ncbi:MAG TPA: HD domain-containing phosphohydrolase [Vicinamibacterales bacterium]
MTTSIESWLRDLQSAVATRRLYPAAHPRNRDLILRLVREAAALTEERPEFSMFADADRIVTDTGLVESSVPLAQGLFETLHAHGFDRLTICRGIGPDELAAFIEELAAPESGASALTPRPHVRFSRLVRAGARDATASPGLTGPEHAGALERVWRSVDAGTIELDLLECLVLALGRTVSSNRDALIPLLLLESHDAYTVTHITNVAVLSMALGSALGFPDGFVHDIGTAALLHDVGKLRVPASILSAKSSLNDEQLAIMRRHPEDGARMLIGLPHVPDLAPIVAFEHHLHHGGGGYPDVPPGWRLHDASEIVHVCDVYDALRSDRPYRAGLEPDVVERMMRADAETVFDPYVLNGFFEHVAPRLVWTAAPTTAGSDPESAAPEAEPAVMP